MKGQLTIIAIIMVFLTLIVFSALVTPLNQVIANTTPKLDNPTAFALGLLPFIIVLTIILSVLHYGRPSYQRVE